MSAGAANVLWSVALLTGLALLAFAMGLAEKPPLCPFERERLQRFTEFDAATLPTRRIMRLAIPPSEEVWRGSGI